MNRNTFTHNFTNALRLFLIAALAAGLALRATPTRVVYAATFTVDSTADAVDANPGNGVCATAGGVCTLRAAVQEANALTGDDTILLPSGTYTLTISNPGGVREDAAATGDLDITSNLVISATGATKPIIDGNGSVLTDTVLSVFSSITVTISGVTLRNGYLVGLANAGTLMLNDSLVIGNTGVNGGGIQNNFGTMTISNSTVSSNASSFGGGIFNLGVLTVTNSLINSNTCNNGLCGGGIYNGNYGVNSGMLTIINTTIISNSIGTLYNYGGLVILRNSTLSSNDSGIRTINSGTTRLSNTIVANSDCIDPVVSDGYNLDSGNTCGFTAPGDITNTDPLLGPLADNGGPTLTLALLPGSPAIDAGNPAGCTDSLGNALTTDQRGSLRPADGDGNGSVMCDIGAYEFGPTGPTVQFSSSDFSINENAGAATITVTLDTASALTVTVDYETSDGTATAGSDYTPITGTLTFTPGVITQTFTVTITDDLFGEADETVILTLGNPVNGTLNLSNSATLTIVDNDFKVYLPLVLR